MKLAEYRSTYYEYTGKLSDIVRQLNFAGIAVVWIFKVGQETGGIPFAQCLLWPMGLFVLSLGFDLLHYIYASIAWGLFHRCKEKNGVNESEEIQARREINWPTNIFFWAKVAASLAGYSILIIYIAAQLA